MDRDYEQPLDVAALARIALLALRRRAASSGPGRETVVSEKRGPIPFPRVVIMFTDITITPMYVTDQDAALAFYRDKLGFVVDTDGTDMAIRDRFGNQIRVTQRSGE